MRNTAAQAVALTVALTVPTYSGPALIEQWRTGDYELYLEIEVVELTATNSAEAEVTFHLNLT